VEAVGDRVTRVHVGDEVLGGTPFRAAGAFADVVVTKESSVATKPASLSYEDAAALPIVAVTALQGLIKNGKLKSGQAVFIHSCLGGVGRSATQIALAHHAKVAGSCRDTRKQEARELGVDPVVEFDFDPTPLKGRFDLVLDTAGALPLKAAQTLLKPGGRIVSVSPSPRNLLRTILPGLFHAMITRPIPEDLEEIARLAGQGALRLPIAQTVPLSEAIPALTELERNGTAKRGKLIITPG
jgi:NADPH:quinone reductase-like Zn-dependent oxidoreductase